MIHVSSHPLVKHKVALLRDRETEPKLFRELVAEITQLLFYEASADLHLEPWTVETPLSEAHGEYVRDQIGIVPILRAGLGMAESILQIVPNAYIWHLGLFRDDSTHQPITYYNKLSEEPNIDIGYIVDPMLATGGSASAAATILKNWGLKQIKFVGLIAAPEGVTVMRNDHPDVPLHLAALDMHLNGDAFIVPGLGDAGDRQFGTTW
jgi:uracil phosphoribosyltransferase